jgi:hypothetical protein
MAAAKRLGVQIFDKPAMRETEIVRNQNSESQEKKSLAQGSIKQQ